MSTKTHGIENETPEAKKIAAVLNWAHFKTELVEIIFIQLIR